eukprot:CAMPEP_0194065370 /NCGR_PEP_ID=MMETSP0009_2-20130614/85432_1 /TAXON_ID=210454 /ORGANISM="Grammatophora oceanica, Strain CCMP 410" /LENGTH=308 /DNA_ID=CAMNT_0038718209 /DNA_START=177 /DNA_END=1103 /DNA_ORIENTATION=-
MKIAAAFSLFMASASAFGPFNTGKSAPTELKVASMNGWAPNDAEFAYGLPGSIDPIADFDPLGLAEKADFGTMMKYREAELQHGRVAMLAAIGMLVTEEPVEFHPLFESYNKDIGPAIRHLDEVRAVSPFFFEILAVIIGALEFNRALTGWLPPDEAEGNNLLKDGYFPGDVGFDPLGFEEFLGPAIRHLDEVRAVSPFFFEILAVIIGSLEFNRALKGWLPPDEAEGNNLLKDGYFPGDVGFDPLGLKPEDPEEFLELHTKELQNGRVAMLGAAGMIAQELVNGKEIFVNLGVAQDRFDPSLLPVQF